MNSLTINGLEVVNLGPGDLRARAPVFEAATNPFSLFQTLDPISARRARADDG